MTSSPLILNELSESLRETNKSPLINKSHLKIPNSLSESTVHRFHETSPLNSVSLRSRTSYKNTKFLAKSLVESENKLSKRNFVHNSEIYEQPKKTKIHRKKAAKNKQSNSLFEEKIPTDKVTNQSSFQERHDEFIDIQGSSKKGKNKKKRKKTVWTMNNKRRSDFQLTDKKTKKVHKDELIQKEVDLFNSIKVTNETKKDWNEVSCKSNTNIHQAFFSYEISQQKSLLSASNKENFKDQSEILQDSLCGGDMNKVIFIFLSEAVRKSNKYSLL